MITDEELNELEIEYKNLGDLVDFMNFSDNIPILIAEVRRQRAEIADFKANERNAPC